MASLEAGEEGRIRLSRLRGLVVHPLFDGYAMSDALPGGVASHGHVFASVAQYSSGLSANRQPISANVSRNASSTGPRS